ncbi:MAG: regulatory protein RecX [Bacteroidia bacterium]
MIYTVTEAIDKLKKFCAYQERSQQEVRQKLYLNGVKGEEAEFVITELISENFLNEERYARAYSRGKFRIKHWGRRKIIAGLKSKGVSERCIKEGLKEISSSEYRQILSKEIKKLHGKYKGKAAEQQLIRNLMGKGFETSLIKELLNEAE